MDSAIIDKVLEIIKEGKDHNYPDFIVRKDLETYLQSELDKAYKDGCADGEWEAKNNC